MSTEVNVTNVFSMQPTYTALGMGQIPAGTTADSAVKAVQKVLATQMTAKWPTEWPTPPSNQQDQGIMGPWNDNIAGTQPQCLVQ